MIPHLDHLHHQCTPPHASFWVQRSLRLSFVSFLIVWQLSVVMQPLCPPLFVVFVELVLEPSFPSVMGCAREVPQFRENLGPRGLRDSGHTKLGRNSKVS
jgi:hypothetical protein